MFDVQPFTALLLYRILGIVASPFAGLLVAYRARQGKEDLSRRRERYGISSLKRPDGPLVWIHAASVGETLAALPLISAIEAQGPHVLLTTGTVTSARLAISRLEERTLHQFVPIDTAPFISRFLDYWHPDLALFVDSELWPMMITELEQRKIPLILVNARMSESSFQRWQQSPRLIQRLLSSVALCLAKSDVDADRYSKLGTQRVEVTGNLKFDAPPQPGGERTFADLKVKIAKRPVWIAASTHPGEEDIILRIHANLAKTYANLLTIIVPRHPQRGNDIYVRAKELGFIVALRSHDEDIEPLTNIYIGDTIGELGLFYRLVPIAFVGGSLVHHGGQNPIEPMHCNAAIIHGPHVDNFTEIYSALDADGGALAINDAKELQEAVRDLLSHPSHIDTLTQTARQTLSYCIGAVDRTMKHLERFLVPLLIAARRENRGANDLL